MKTLYTARATTIGGREGHVETDDKILSLNLTKPGTGNGTNPEQLFIAGYASCFCSAVEAVAKKQNQNVGQVTVHGEASLNQDDSGFFISAALDVDLPNIDAATAQNIVEAAHQMCPYSKATRGNIDVRLTVNQQPLKAAA